MTTKELYTQGARIWVPHPKNVWESATVTADFRSGVLIVKLDTSSQIQQIKVQDDNSLPPLCNPSLLIGQNDLTSLSYLHEPAVLHNLKVRFCERNAIYTYCGIVLVAINPYYELPIYGDETIMAYRGQAMGDLDPHIFAVSEEAFTKLERENRDQSIIVSGESGAGKTVSAKYAMRYFAAVGGNANETQVERKVLASSPIMEAIGNAKTTRNDNSSRFGKFIEIHFDRAYRISGASMRTYLLEKSRVVHQSSGERNYHVFYQLCAARQLYPQLQLGTCTEFYYLSQGASPAIPGVDDLRAFSETRQALSTLGVSEEEQLDMFKILAVVLHLGNVDICDGDPSGGKEDGAFIKETDASLDIVCSLLGVQRLEMSRWLTHRRIQSAHEVVVSRMDIDKACFARDALAKRIYSDLFGWTVKCVNRALETGVQPHHFIGVLDIYGFETFEINSFEQFCINYANEKLQQQFNSHVFKLEQDEYIKEEITWTMIHFYDNQPCIELIEARMGVLSLLDEECRVPQGSDQGFVDKLRAKCDAHNHLVAPRLSHTSFVIKHFADDVEYESGGFLEKNRDSVHEEQLECVRSGRGCALLARIGAPDDDGGKHSTLPLPGRRVAAVPHASLPPRRPSGQKQTVGAQFRASLSALMATLSATTPHYVRCIKPNEHKKPFVYDSAMAVQQLRACGVLETIRISAAGFPSRWLYQDFFQRYRLLCPSNELDRSDLKATCRRTLERNIKDPDKYQFGTSKIFFRAGQVAYLEKVRTELQRLYCVRVQSCVRRFVARSKYVRLVRALRALQARARGYLARRRAREIRRNRAAVVVQRNVRGWLARLRFARLRRLCVALQARARGYLARRLYSDKRRMRAAITIQRQVRGWLARRRVADIKRQVVLCQAAVRRHFARKRYRQLRTEARSLEHVKKLNKGLENKIISLQQKLGHANDRNKMIEPLQTQILDLKSKLETYRQMEIEIKSLKSALIERDTTIVNLHNDLSSERDNISKLKAEKIASEKKRREVEDEYNKQMQIIREKMQTKEHEHLELVKEREAAHAAEKRALEAELESERSSRQKLLSSQYDLQERLEQQQQTNKAPQNKEHRRSLSDVSNHSQQEGAVEDDYGYGSVRSVESSRPALEAVNWVAGAGNSGPTPMADAGLVLRMQGRVAAAQTALDRVTRRCRDLEERLAVRTTPLGGASAERFRAEELEMENVKLRARLDQLRAGGGDAGATDLEQEMQELRKELDRRRDECVQLKSVLSNQRPWFQALKDVTFNLKSLASSNYGQDVDIANEDSELAQAFEAQKLITRQLEDELTAEKKYYHDSILEYKQDIDKLRDECEKLQKLLAAGLTADGKSPSELYVQNEMVRLSAENMELRDRIDRLSESCRRYKNQIKLLADKLKDTTGLEDVSVILENGDTSAINANSSFELLPTVRKKEREYLGMFEYKIQDEGKIIKRLVYDLKPSVAVTLLPGLPAYIMLMMLRHMDHVDDEPKMHKFMKAMRFGVKKTLKRRPDSVEYSALWLANMLRLLNNLRQYSGDDMYQHSNTPRQNQQCLRIFDLTQYRQVLSDTAVWIYQGLINILERQLERLIVPAILEHEEISGLSGPARTAQSPAVHSGPSKLKHELGRLRETLAAYDVDASLVVMIFKQLFYFICAFSLNQLLLRKDLCCWAKGLQIRYNISHLETWIKEKLAEHGQERMEEILGVLRPITQAVQLLQARKSMQDVQSTVDMCADLTAMQVCKILNMYTPAEEYEIKITREFIHEIQRKMQERAGAAVDKEPQNSMLMDSKLIFAVQFPFNPSPIRLEDIELPEVLGLGDVLTKL